MTAPIEEAWTPTPILTNREPRWGLMIQPDGVVLGFCAETFAMHGPIEEAREKMPARVRLASAAPDMARALLAADEAITDLIQRDDAYGARTGDDDVQRARDGIDAALRKAGVR